MICNYCRVMQWLDLGLEVTFYTTTWGFMAGYLMADCNGVSLAHVPDVCVCGG
jgi:hypothetical protein